MLRSDKMKQIKAKVLLMKLSENRKEILRRFTNEIGYLT